MKVWIYGSYHVYLHSGFYILSVLNEIAIASTNGTDATMAATKYFLDYAASNQDAVIRYQASDMILYIVSDAAYLVLSE
jgi:hypothetical protein